MAARIVSCLGAGVCEAMPVQLVNDIFFLHERGLQLGYYTCNADSTKFTWRNTIADDHVTSCVMPGSTRYTASGLYAPYQVLMEAFLLRYPGIRRRALHPGLFFSSRKHRIGVANPRTLRSMRIETRQMPTPVRRNRRRLLSSKQAAYPLATLSSRPFGLGDVLIRRCRSLRCYGGR